MAGKIVIVALALFVGCVTAIPTPDQPKTKDFFFNQLDSSPRIVGGTQAATGSHPHMVALTNGVLVRSFFCGGSLIGQRTVLTAAHCTDSVYSWGGLSNSVRATVGTNRWNTGGQSYAISRNVTHPNYVSGIIKNDISVLITSSNVVYSALVNPISITYDFIEGGVDARVAGWGRTRAGAALSSTLLEITVPTLEGARCVADAAAAGSQLDMPAPAVEPHLELCTYHAPGTGTCNGDSGSALSRVSDGSQIGVVSWGFPCGLGAPDMFARVSAFADWLKQNIV